MSNDNSQHNKNSGLTILTLAGILEFTAGMIWYNQPFRRWFKKGKTIQENKVLSEQALRRDDLK
jgi:hypothetical protein